MPLTPGARLGPYEVLSALGAGGMGDVYRARDTRLDRTVAIKVISDALAGSPELRERFDREARAIAALNHPHICTLYDVGHEGGVDFIVLEYLDGESLAERLTRVATTGSRLPIDDVLRYAIEIASALDKAHASGIVHRDLKPANVFLTKSGSKLLDFGLAKTGAAATPATASVLPTTPPALTHAGDIWVLDVARGSAAPLTSDPGEELFPLWTADGRQIVYYALGESRTVVSGDFYRKVANGAGGVDRSQDGHLKLANAILDDGSVLFDALDDGQMRLEVVSNEKESRAVLTKHPVVTMASVAADGRSIAYNALGDSGRVEVFVDSFPTPGKKRQVSTAGGYAPRWRRDGREIFYLAPNHRLMAVRVTITADAIEPDAPVPLFEANVAGGSAPVGSSTMAFRREYDVSADGQRFLLNLVTASSMSITVATNWTSRLAGAR